MLVAVALSFLLSPCTAIALGARPAITAAAPFERVKMLSQTGEGGKGALAITKRVVQTEGMMGLFAGNGANLLRVFPAKGGNNLPLCSTHHLRVQKLQCLRSRILGNWTIFRCGTRESGFTAGTADLTRRPLFPCAEDR